MRGSSKSDKALTPITNRLLDALSSQDRTDILNRCETITLEFGAILCEPDQPYEYVYFPLSGYVSLVKVVGNHEPLGLGLIGNEGMLGVTLALGMDAAPLRGIVQGAGTALRMRSRQLRKQLQASSGLLAILQRYLYVTLVQLAQTAGCTHFHEIEARLSRWLLMTHDRAHGDHFHLTHKFLADMLGVQRSAVTIAAGALQKRKLIHYTRGEINILDRRGLEAASCQCYDAVIDAYARQFSH